MNKQQLYKLRQESTREFENSRELRLFLDGLLGAERKFPLVVGYPNFNPKTDWKVVELDPLRKTDRLTVENYIQALEYAEREVNKHFQLQGEIFYEGVESLHYSNWHSKILNVSLRDPKSLLQTFNLDFYLNHLASEDKVGYAVFSEVTPTPLEKIARRFVGPNDCYEEYPK